MWSWECHLFWRILCCLSLRHKIKAYHIIAGFNVRPMSLNHDKMIYYQPHNSQPSLPTISRWADVCNSCSGASGVCSHKAGTGRVLKEFPSNLSSTLQSEKDYSPVESIQIFPAHSPQGQAERRSEKHKEPISDPPGLTEHVKCWSSWQHS